LRLYKILENPKIRQVLYYSGVFVATIGVSYAVGNIEEDITKVGGLVKNAGKIGITGASFWGASVAMAKLGVSGMAQFIVSAIGAAGVLTFIETALS
jgi:hypothetical protein